MADTPQWRFRQMRPGEINVDPIEGGFFSTEAIENITDALVREAVQNSLDADDGEGPVTVCFSFHTPSRAKRDSHRRKYLEGLFPHLAARHAGLHQAPSPREEMDFLVIEDYGTHGLQGDIHQYDDLDDPAKRNDFYYFWRNIGRTRKHSTDRGRWGLGKTVFQAASRINSFFGLTTRRDDGKSCLMGQSVLKIHKIDGTRYNPYGYFGYFQEDLALPIEMESWLSEFADLFHLDRSDKPGLSILIPYPDKELDAPDCIRSVVKHYFFPILSGQLMFNIRGSGGKSYRLDAASLDSLLKKPVFKKRLGLGGLLHLARWAIKQAEKSSLISLKPPQPGRAPKLRDTLFEPNSLVRIQQRFAQGKPLAFHVPLTIRKHSDKTYHSTGFSVFLELDDTLQRAEDHFIRQGITIPEVTSLKHKGIRAIVSITDPVLSAFLGDAENPAHTDWERNNKRFKHRYHLAVSTLDFVKTSPRELVKILTQPKKGRDENLLRHIFSLASTVDDLPESREIKSPDTDNIEVTPNSIIEVFGGKPLKLTAVKGGFSLTKTPKAEKVPKTVTIWMAYEVRRGNPFKKYTPLDFEVGVPPIDLATEGARIVLKKNNVIQLELLRADFKLVVTGFDMYRDLRIKTFP